MRLAQDAAHIHEAMDGAFAAFIVDRHAGRCERIGIFRALVAQRIVPGGDDQRRREAGIVLIERRDRARVGNRPGDVRNNGRRTTGSFLREEKVVGEVLPRRQAAAEIERRIDQHLRPNRRGQPALGLVQGDGSNPPPALSPAMAMRSIEAQALASCDEPFKRRDAVLNRGGKLDAQARADSRARTRSRRVSWHSVRQNTSWLSTSPMTQPPP